ncbi:TPA: DnaD domain protein [Staphylococcus aureus]|uniref:DnaD domain-containing protein n=2 Tax=Staphylococcus aureus TaxID=1280 RepID=UPI0013DA7081|nr:DnaD domain protein [Staphylococcus aureus]MCT4681416.1 DnaD domain protein [Staphylococcus aureus]HCV7610780.1 DnaD domain protein [Staphylococcus aureus]HCV7613552.1 DnaD domain protein [Staphylococcus aureus]HCV9089863.1 DnaD domain protein [Staphylococcus aureus]HCV9462399.1 DnaD domain protein [Staphylococcus aureus]
MTGWIKLHRKLLDSPIFQNEKLFKVFAYCLMKASHKDHTQLVGRRVVELEKGQFVFGRKRASEELRLKESTVRDYIKLLENLGTIVVKSDNKFSVITVVNWAIYQSMEENSDSKNDNKSTTNQQQINTNKNVKNGDNVKNGENEKKKTTAFDFFQDNGFGFITSYNLDDLNYYLDSFENDSDEIVTASLKIAKDRNKVTWGYAKSILNTWLNANLKSIEQVRAFEKQQLESKKQNYKPFVKQSKEKTPKWLTDSTRETKTPEVDENLEKDREAFIKRLNSKWE